MEYNLMIYSPAVLAESATFVACKILQPDKTIELEMDRDELRRCAKDLVILA
jgi:hypothetical protein